MLHEHPPLDPDLGMAKDLSDNMYVDGKVTTLISLFASCLFNFDQILPTYGPYHTFFKFNSLTQF